MLNQQKFRNKTKKLSNKKLNLKGCLTKNHLEHLKSLIQIQLPISIRW